MIHVVFLILHFLLLHRRRSPGSSASVMDNRHPLTIYIISRPCLALPIIVCLSLSLIISRSIRLETEKDVHYYHTTAV